MHNLKDIRTALSGRFRKPDLKLVLAYLSIFLLTWISMSEMRIKGFYMDDLVALDAWSEMGRSIWKFTWYCADGKVRPVSLFFMAVGFKLFGANTEKIWLWMFLVNLLTYFTVFFVFRKVLGRKLLALGGTLVLVFARFGCYAQGQYHGVFEQVSNVCALLVLFYLLKSLEEPEPGKSVIKAAIISFVAIFAHERYLVLPVLVILGVVILSAPWKKKVVWLSIAAGCLAVALLIRSLIFGNDQWGGTGGTNLAETADITMIFRHLLMCIGYLFGIHVGEPYMVGYTYDALPQNAYVLMAVSFGILLFCLIRTLRNNPFKAIWKRYFLLIAFIGATTVASCVTIRVELRWLYAPFMGLVLLFLFLLRDSKFTRAWVKQTVPAVVLTCMLLVELIFHGGYGKMYFRDSQVVYDQIYELTWSKYEYGFYGMKVLVISNGTDHVVQDKLQYFFDVYAGLRGQAAPEVVVFDTAEDVIMDGTEDIILSVDKSTDTYESLSRVNDVTKEMLLAYQYIAPAGNTIREAEELTGFHSWERNKSHIWGKKEMSMKISTGETGVATLKGNLADHDTSNVLTVYFDDVLIGTYNLTNQVELTFQLPANQEGYLRLVLDHADSPADLGINPDQRILGLCIKELSVQ